MKLILKFDMEKLEKLKFQKKIPEISYISFQIYCLYWDVSKSAYA